MTNTGLTITAVVLTALHTLLWVVAGRHFATSKRSPTKPLQSPIEVTTADQRTRGESSFIIAEARQHYVSRGCFLALVICGYVVIAAAWAVAYWFLCS